MSHSLNNPFAPFDPALEIALASNIAAAVAEDVGSGDLTGLLVPAGEWVRARVLVRETAILCGAPWFAGVMREIDPALRIDWRYAEGATMHADSEVCIIDGPARSLLTAERSALNFLQLLSGVATATSRYVAASGRHRRRDPGYAQDLARPAAGAKIRGAGRRRPEPAAGPV